MDVADFAAEYKTKSDEELLRIHFDAAELTDEARLALTTEMHARSIDKPRIVSEFHDQEQKTRNDDELERVRFDARKVFGFRFGRADYEYDPDTGIETFATTLFLNLSSIPIIPLGTYRVEKKKGLRFDYRIVQKLPFNWHQALHGWSYSAIVVFAAIVFFLLATHRLHG